MRTRYHESPARADRDDRAHSSAPQRAPTEIPEHLRWKPIATGAEWSNVPSRYMASRERKLPVVQTYKRDFTPLRGWESVSSRYLEPKPSLAPSPPPARFGEKELRDHASFISKSGFGQVHTRFMEGVLKDESFDSPRRRVERLREGRKRESGWRDNVLNAAPMTFDEIRRRNKRILNFERKPKMTKPSVVAEYIRSGTPIRHHIMGSTHTTPRRSHSADPVISDLGKWVPPGGCGGGRWYTRANSPSRPATQRENELIAAWRDGQHSKLMGKGRVPRVATLSPAESYRRWVSEQAPEQVPIISDPPRQRG